MARSLMAIAKRVGDMGRAWADIFVGVFLGGVMGELRIWAFEIGKGCED